MTTGEPGALPEGLGDAVRGTAADIGAVLRGIGDTGRPVPRLTWTVGETAAHLAQANELMADLAAGRPRPHGDGTPGSIARANEEGLRAFPERRAEPLAAMIEAQAEALLAAVGSRTPGGVGAGPARVVTPMGELDHPVLAAYLLTHMLGHGYDLARAAGRPHMIDRRRVGLTLPFLVAAMPRTLNEHAVAGLTARYALRLRGGGGLGVTVEDGRLTTSLEPPARPDCTMLMEPVTFFLVALGRANPWVAVARGRILNWGRKPWLAPRFPSFFTAP
ncbi:maleylpyruvate isomerase family mycothiol-dependent enzyme [Streptomyces sp. NPDC051940]|uniref:maleylpyruvate isomerase family mycothiol-dependent enzyme n=1 Tax=Streptomyces sp. NPDC051940 TaxID=3155675 RepID=UPI00341E8CDD